jgi:sodium transport system permease protein
MAFVLFFSVGSLAQGWNLVWGMVITQIVLIAGLAAAFAWYLKLNYRRTFRLRLPAIPHAGASILLALASVVIALVIDRLQSIVYDTSRATEEMFGNEMLTGMPIAVSLIVFALLPALCEEILFRGFILSAFSSRLRAWKAILFTGTFFGFFHVTPGILRIVPAAHIVIGILISYLVYRSNSLYTGVLFHLTYNGTLVALGQLESQEWIRGGEIPPTLIVAAIAVFVAGAGLSLFLPRRGTFDSGNSSDIIRGTD